MLTICASRKAEIWPSNLIDYVHSLMGYVWSVIKSVQKQDGQSTRVWRTFSVVFCVSTKQIIVVGPAWCQRLHAKDGAEMTVWQQQTLVCRRKAFTQINAIFFKLTKADSTVGWSRNDGKTITAAKESATGILFYYFRIPPSSICFARPLPAIVLQSVLFTGSMYPPVIDSV